MRAGADSMSCYTTPAGLGFRSSTNEIQSRESFHPPETVLKFEAGRSVCLIGLHSASLAHGPHSKTDFAILFSHKTEASNNEN